MADKKYVGANRLLEIFQNIKNLVDLKQDKTTAVTHTEASAVGSATKPVYINSNGVATATTYELNKTVPANAKFTDTTYTAATTSANGLMSSSDKTKLNGIASGAEVNVQSDWDVTDTTADAYIKNKPASLPASDVKAWAKADTKPTYTASEVGALASTVTHLSGDLAVSLKGSANGLAELDENGKVPSGQLPSYVDDVLEYTNKASFPATGETGKIYVDKTTNLTWRWSGTAYVEISPSLALGETSSTAYRGDRGKTAYDHSQSTHARTDATKTEASTTNGNIKINGTETTVYTHPSGTNPHGTTKSDVGLGNVGNFKAVSTVASQGLTDTEKSNARANIGAGTSSLAIGTTSTTAAAGNHTHSAYVNQNAFSNVTVGETTIAADSATDTLTLVAGSNITITPDATNDKVTIAATDTTYSAATTSAAGLMSASDKTKLDGIATGANKYSLPTASASKLGGVKVGTNLSISGGVLSATDTTYSSKSAASGGTDVSLVTTGEKYTWNNKGTYSKPSGGIPKTDLASAVQTSLGKADSALQSYTETDPVFLASAASGITSSDISNWNGKTSNTGTVTSVAIKMNGSSKGTVTTSGTIDLGTVLTSHQDISGKQDKLTAGSNITISGSTISATDTTYSAATTSAAGLMSAADKTKLNGIATGANNYSLPTASASTLGGVKVGNNLSISSGVLSAVLGLTTGYFSSDVTKTGALKNNWFNITAPSNGKYLAIANIRNVNSDLSSDFDIKIVFENATNVFAPLHRILKQSLIYNDSIILYGIADMVSGSKVGVYADMTYTKNSDLWSVSLIRIGN